MVEPSYKITKILSKMIKHLFNIKASMSFICLIGLSYQAFDLFGEYARGKTVVNIQVGQKLDGIPAITIMMGTLSIDKFAGYSKKFAKIYRNYTKIVKLSRNSSLNSMKAGIVFYQAHDEVQNLIQRKEFNVGQLFFNYSAGCRTSDNRSRIDARLGTDSNLIMKGRKKINFNKEYRLKTDPDASLIYERRMWKCFTIFSEIHRSWSNFSAIYTKMVIEIEHDINSIPHVYYPFAITFHSTNDLSLVESGKIRAIRSSALYMAQYSQIKIERLGQHYDTDCVQYGIGQEFITMNDCLLMCHQDKHDQVCDDKSKMVRSTFLVREELVKINSNRYLSDCEDYENLKQEITLSCSKQCKLPCTYSYYPVSFQKLGDLDFGRTRLFVEHDEMPDILIRYIPEISFISFVCNFGGLLGMWLGLSFLNMVESFKNIIFNISFKEVFSCKSKRTVTMFNRIYVTTSATR